MLHDQLSACGGGGCTRSKLRCHLSYCKSLSFGEFPIFTVLRLTRSRLDTALYLIAIEGHGIVPHNRSEDCPLK